MGIADYQPRRYELRDPDGQVVCTLRGLTTTDIGVLVEQHLPDLEAVFDLFKLGRSMTDEEATSLIVPMLQAAPGLMANVIALAADEPNAGPAIQDKFSFPMQLEALERIGDKTFTEVASVKKIMGIVAALLNKKNTGITKT